MEIVEPIFNHRLTVFAWMERTTIIPLLNFYSPPPFCFPDLSVVLGDFTAGPCRALSQPHAKINPLLHGAGGGVNQVPVAPTKVRPPEKNA